MKSIETDKYTCAGCGGTFTKEWSDEEAFQESLDKFGADLFKEPIAVVCDDCYKKLMGTDETS